LYSYCALKLLTNNKPQTGNRSLVIKLDVLLDLRFLERRIFDVGKADGEGAGVSRLDVHRLDVGLADLRELVQLVDLLNLASNMRFVSSSSSSLGL